ncbi:nucleoside triphosphate pyrophosphohydrolase [Thiospirochaeta perfilievii]|uniref:Nucleoside triphosphate pyrophosphohydrolase n=1 Tax=Thiospirochaeta perfilievii TaxID=252967 RepID=A0A5C1QI08_9SPIO|nr:nucleoside triphosphate pyrophosphohydrolase [Thiospirochaeta perfilievii]QEN06174.1 nucleoside triphosphate pyrophosphohydrolase [Thiospirochaeta perfilievii]
MNNSEYSRLLDIIKKLRDPQSGCPWDLKQSVESLAPALLEECCECIDGVNNRDLVNIKEELGDIIFTTSLISYIIEQENNGSIDDIIKNVNDKMVRRHPHIFSNTQGVDSSEKVLQQWEEIKKNQEGRVKKNLLDKIPTSLPPLEKSFEIQKKVEKVGFDWENINDIFNKILEETQEVKDAIDSNNQDNLEMEIGDLLFSVVNLSRFLKIDPSKALARTNNKFLKRFSFIEDQMRSKELVLHKDNFKIMDELWDKSKELEK